MLHVQSGMAIWLLGLLTAELMLGHSTISQVTPTAVGPLFAACQPQSAQHTGVATIR